MRKGVLMAMMIGVTIQLGLAAVVGALVLDHLFIYVWKVSLYYGPQYGIQQTLPTIWNSIWLLIKVSVLWAILTAKINLKE